MKRHVLRRLIAALVIAAIWPVFAAAQETDQSERDAALVQALFAATAGTTAELEKAARQDLTGEEIELCNAENAAYRAQTRQWLLAVLACAAPEPDMAAPSPEPDETPAPEQAAEPAWDEICALFETTQPGRDYLALLDAEDAEARLEETRAAYWRWTAEIDAVKLSEINPDYACWIFAPDSPIDYPVVQGEDNDYYLHRLFNGAENACGTLFVDYRNLPGFQDPNTLIYGHHMRNGSMFKSITYYADQSYFEAHPYWLILTPDAHYLVEVLAGYTTSKNDHCYDIAISDPQDLADFAQAAREKSNFLSDVAVEPGDRLVTLSTCAYAFENARYILIGRLERIESLPAEA